jgi:hypothetical protein
MQTSVQSAPPGRAVAGIRLAVALLGMLAACEVVVLQLYVGATAHLAQLSVELEYARGAALIASAQAQRCGSVAERK